MAVADDAIRFSVVIPAFNEEGYLDASLESLQRQDFAGRYEIVVVDNNSTDGTSAVARRRGIRVLHEPMVGVCAARQRGIDESTGEIVVSTDADTVHPRDWLTRMDARFRTGPDVVAVAGPCVYGDPPWWAAIFPRLWFAAIAAVYSCSGRVFYLTATNVAFVRTSFPGYDTTITQGGDEVDVLRRLRGRGRIVWDANNSVVTSSRRMDQGLAYTLIVSYGYHYALSYVLNRLSARDILGPAPAIRREHEELVHRRRRRWRGGLAAVSTVLVATTLRRPDSRLRSIGAAALRRRR